MSRIIPVCPVLFRYVPYYAGISRVIPVCPVLCRFTVGERKAAMHYGSSFIKEKGYPPSTQLVRVIDGAEAVAFKALFKGWKDVGEVENVFIHRKKGYEAPEETEVEDLAAQMKVIAKREQESLMDDGRGEVQIWRVENFEMAPVDPKTYGQFYAGDSYLLFYKLVVVLLLLLLLFTVIF